MNTISPAGTSSAGVVAPAPGTSGATMGGRRRTARKGPSAKALKRVLKSHGLKSSGKKSTLRARAKKAHLLSKA
jgi:hypothetical protein